jgi:hypothetical protein
MWRHCGYPFKIYNVVKIQSTKNAIKFSVVILFVFDQIILKGGKVSRLWLDNILDNEMFFIGTNFHRYYLNTQIQLILKLLLRVQLLVSLQNILHNEYINKQSIKSVNI